MAALRAFDWRDPGVFRLILALVVVVDHMLGVHLGMAAVYLFFILSGFWMQRVWTQRYIRGGAVGYAIFVASRLWRLIPVMAVAVAMALMVRSVVLGEPYGMVLAQFDPGDLISHLVILGYGGVEPLLLVPPAWTLDLEVQFYIMVPLLCLALARLRVGVFLGLGVAMSAIGWAVPSGLPVLPYLALFMAGMAAAAHVWKPGQRLVRAAIALAAVIAALLITSGHSAVFFSDAALWPNGVLNAVLAVVLAPVALATVWRQAPRHDGACGDLSYIVYLMHWPVLSLVVASVGGASSGIVIAVFLTLLAAVSLATWRLIDAPLNRMRTRVVGGWLARAAARRSSHGARGQGHRLA